MGKEYRLFHVTAPHGGPHLSSGDKKNPESRGCDRVVTSLKSLNESRVDGDCPNPSTMFPRANGGI